MRIRSALTASVLAAGVLLGGAGAALADDGFSLDYFDGGHMAFASHCSSFAAVPDHFGPLYSSSCTHEAEAKGAEAGHLGTN